MTSVSVSSVEALKESGSEIMGWYGTIISAGLSAAFAAVLATGSFWAFLAVVCGLVAVWAMFQQLISFILATLKVMVAKLEEGSQTTP